MSSGAERTATNNSCAYESVGVAMVATVATDGVVDNYMYWSNE